MTLPPRCNSGRIPYPPTGDATLDRYALLIAPTARRQLTDQLPEAISAAAYELITGPLLESPHRVGKRLRLPLDDRHSARRGTYRVIYRIDEHQRTVTVIDVAHRRDVYRPR